MQDNSCEMARECPHETRIALMESKIKNLEDGQDREESFRKTYYADREARIKRDAELDATLNTIKANVDKLVKRQDEEDAKPRKRWDGVVDKVLYGLVGVLVTALGGGILYLLTVAA